MLLMLFCLVVIAGLCWLSKLLIFINVQDPKKKHWYICAGKREALAGFVHIIWRPDCVFDRFYDATRLPMVSVVAKINISQSNGPREHSLAASVLVPEAGIINVVLPTTGNLVWLLVLSSARYGSFVRRGRLWLLRPSQRRPRPERRRRRPR